MKKFLLSLCMIAVASVCVFSLTSCKDDEEDMQNSTTVSGNIDSILSGQTAKGVSYSFTIDGQTYPSWAAAKDALSKLPAGTHTIQASMTKDGKTYQGNPSTFTIPQNGSVVVSIDLPTSDSLHSTGAQFTITTGHSGGSVK